MVALVKKLYSFCTKENQKLSKTVQEGIRMSQVLVIRIYSCNNEYRNKI